MIDTVEELALWFSCALILIVGIAFLWLDIYRPNVKDAEIEEAMRRLEAEEKRFRIGEVDRRNLAQ